MRNLFTLIVSFLLLTAGVTAQNNLLGQSKSTQDVKVTKKNLRSFKVDPKYSNRLKSQTSERDLTVSFPLDYDQEDRDFATSVGSTIDQFIWALNDGYTNNDTFNLTRAMVFFDTIPDGTPGSSDFYPVNATTMTIDSLDVWVSHVNNSGGTDSIKIRILDAVGLTVVGNDVTGTVLWQTTLTSDTGLTASGFIRPLTVVPNLTLAQGQTFVVKVDYIGPAIDTFFVVASERDDCFGTCLSEPSVIPFNSFFYLNFITGGGNNLSGFNYLVSDCDGDNMTTPGSCEWFGPQNFFFFPFITADVALSASVSADTLEGCENDVSNLTVNVAGAQPPVTYAWSPTTGLSDPTSPTPQALFGLSDVTYTVTVTDGNADMTTAQVTLNSRGLDVTLPPTSLPCGGTANITAAVTGDNIGIQYLWNDNTTNFTNTVSSAGTYSITVTNLAGCSADASVNVGIANVNQDLNIMLPNNPNLPPDSWCENESITINNTSSFTSGWTFTWDYGDGNSTSGLGGFNTYAADGSYTITLTGDSAGCSFSEMYSITIIDQMDPGCFVGINDISLNNMINVRPNPATDVVNVTIDGSYDEMTIRLFDLKGTTILENAYNSVSDLNETIDVSKLPQGTYLIKFETSEGVGTKKFVVTK